MKHYLFVAVMIGLLSSLVLSDEPVKSPQMDFLLWGRMTMGQVVSSQKEAGTYDYDFQGEWLENIDAGLKITRQVTPYITGRLNVGFTASASRVKQYSINSVELTSKLFSAYPLDATIQYQRNFESSGDKLLMEVGYFPFKYNQQSTNLGEYLFRTCAYPQIIISGFENSNIDKPKLAGFHCSWDLSPNLKFDAIANTELDIYPLRDINLTHIVTASLPRIGNLSFGVQNAHLIAMDDQKTIPGMDKRRYPNVNYWVGYVDTATNDTTMYTFRGTKLMCKAMLDGKGLLEKLIGENTFFGKEDFKIYSEMAVLGVKDYPGWYDDISQRVPVMVGANLLTNQFASYCVAPVILAYCLDDQSSYTKHFGTRMKSVSSKTAIIGGSGAVVGAGLWALEKYFNINTRLDQLTFEMEFFNNPYWNSQEFIWKNGTAVPYTGNSNGLRYEEWSDSLAKKDDDIKWSLYASKKFNSWFRLSGQIACDHTPRNWYTAAPPSFVKYTEMVPRTKKDWYYMMRMSFYF